jgi:hypothetical protein
MGGIRPVSVGEHVNAGRPAKPGVATSVWFRSAWSTGSNWPTHWARRLASVAAVVALALCSSLAWAAPATLVVGPQGRPFSLDEALLQARDGDTIELLPGEYTAAATVIENRRLLIRGVGKRPLISGGGKVSKAKALWLIRGGEVTIENLEFRGFRAADGEGAALRMEGGRLTLRKSELYDNEYGLHALNDEQAELIIEDCVFGLAPKVVGALHHLLNVGRIKKLSVSGSRFQQGFEGQMIKSRARENLITYNFIHDGQRGGASYEIEIAAGGLATILGNVIGQGADTQNPVLVAYGTEKSSWDRNALVVAHNTFISYGWTPAWFVRVIAKNLPDGTEVIAVNNLLVGNGLLWPALGGDNVRAEGNRHISRRWLRDADTYAFELTPSSLWRGSAVNPHLVAGRDLSPKGEFSWPVGVARLPNEPPRWAPGAYQR